MYTPLEKCLPLFLESQLIHVLEDNETALPEDDEDLMDGPEWYQNYIKKKYIKNSAEPDAVMVTTTGNLDTIVSSDYSNDTESDYDKKSIHHKKDSGGTFGQDLPEFHNSAATPDRLNVDGIDCPELDEIYLDHQLEYMMRLIEKENLPQKWLHLITTCK